MTNTATKYSDIDAIQTEIDSLVLQRAAANAAGLTAIVTALDAMLVTQRALITDTTTIASANDTVPIRLESDGTFREVKIGTVITASISGAALTTGTLAQFAATSSAELRGVLSDENGTGLAYFQGGDIGTPSAGVATNLTGTAAGLTAGAVTGGAPLASPTFTGTPAAPTAAPGTNTTQLASTAFVAAAVAALTGVLSLKGSQDCSGTPNYPAGAVGDMYYVTVAGKIGGASGKSVDVGDSYICLAINAGGTEASVGTSWFVLEHNLTGALVAANNLSDVTAATALTNLGFSTFIKTLIDDADAATARTTLGAGVGSVTSVFGVTSAITAPVAQVADSGTAGGNARGTNATDWSRTRSSALMVASGTNSVVAGGIDNKANATNSAVGGGTTNYATGAGSTVVGGNGNQAIGANSVVGGQSCSAGSGVSPNNIVFSYASTATAERSGIYAGVSHTVTDGAEGGVILGGSNSTINAAAQYALIAAGHYGLARFANELVHASGFTTTKGSAQRCQDLLIKITTTATQAELITEGTGAQLVLPNVSTWAFRAKITARRTDATGENSSWFLEGLISRDANAASTAIVGTVTTTLVAQNAAASAYAVTCVADTSTGALVFKVTGEASKTIRWFASVDIEQVMEG